MKLEKEEIKKMEHLFWLVKNCQWPEMKGDASLGLTEMIMDLYKEFKRCKEESVEEIAPAAKKIRKKKDASK